MEKENYKSPIERKMKKSFEEMTREEFTRIKIISSLVFSSICVVMIFLFDKAPDKLNTIGLYIIVAIFLFIGWYFLFWSIFCKIRKIKK